MTKEIVLVPFSRYRTPDGRPTCALNFTTGDVCACYMTQRYGQSETCVFAPNDGKYRISLQRVLVNGAAYLQPLKICPVWAVEAEN